MRTTITGRMLLGGLLAAAPLATLAQTTPDRWGSWLIGTITLPGNAEHRWGGFVEGQLRLNAVGQQYYYHEYKGGLSYDPGPNLSVLLGSGRYVTNDFRDLNAAPLTRETRLWEQAVLTQYARRLKLEHRYRLEQRWLRLRPDSAAFRQRLRYRLSLLLPLNGQKITVGTAFASVYDEIFLNPARPSFERNRFYAGLGYQADKHLVVQLGWLHQADYSRPGAAGDLVVQTKNNLVLSLSYKILRHAPGTEQQMPSLQE